MNVTEIKPPKRVLDQFDFTIFLAGAIDMGSAVDWQTEVVKHLESKKDESTTSIGVFNPRRNDWDETWKQDINNSKFFEQVSWELSHIDNCDIAVVYFTKDSKAPITLMELGKLSEIKPPEHIIVFCPEGYHRKGNVDIVCYKKGIAVHTKPESFYAAIDKALGLSEPQIVSESVQDVSIVESRIEKDSSDEGFVEIELFETIETATLGEQNLLVVTEYDEVKSDDSCIMGNVTFRDKKFFAGICKENGSVKTNLYFKRDGQRVSEKFTIVTTSDEYPTEQIIIAKEH